MKNSIFIMLAIVGLLSASCNSQKREGNPRVLVFSKTAGFYHNSIPKGVEALQKLGMENGFEVDTTKNAAFFQEDSLAKYAAVIFLNTTGNVLDYRQEAAFERYIQSGGGFVGIHAAADTEYDWHWYGKMNGAYFKSHPETQEAKFIIKDKNFGATSFLTDTVWERTDELYNFKMLNPDVNVLMTIDESSYEGGENGDHHPMSWYHEYDGGRAFYTAMGHTKESFSEEDYLKHLLGGIQYAMGDNENLNYDNAKTLLPPEEERFSKTLLAQGEFFEPTEMTILPNFDVLITQRRGEILLYKNETKEVKQVGFLDAYFKTSVPKVNAEEGVLGIAKDPDYENNHWVYIYYSPADTSVNRLSRFTFENDTLDIATEKVILDVWSQREICCHTGGSIAFGPDGLLYLSTGDNATPFNEPGAKFVNSGYGPLNDLPGKQQYDARRSSGNTNDLRGKILRIRVNDDASYDIPEGNLFPEGTEKTRPEIYVMGNRNPYRISVDQKNSTLYWGEVGPDARADSLETRGSRGYDEVNQAQKAGYFGWPLFVGNNYPYVDFDYATGESGETFDPQHPVNTSANNTGLKDLPPAQPAFIWYPYAESPDFPQVGAGGRNAMAGPVYYTDMFPEDTRLPDYYNGKLIIYDWIRGWIKAVSMFEDGKYMKMEPFFPDIKVNSLIDMEVGPDGKLYLLEYGSGWFSKNENAALARIDFNAGNMPPRILAFEVDKTSGILPFSVKATAQASDLEKDSITYIWDLGNGTTKETTEPVLSYTYETAGDFNISVEAKDAKGASARSEPVHVYAGNEVPQIEIQLTEGNKTFYLPGVPIRYAVNITDETDTAAVDPKNLMVSVDYIEGFDKAATTMGHQQGEALIQGKSLVESLDCKSCHKENEKSIGPAYLEVAQKYNKNEKAMNYLVEKIIKGGGGVWGEVQMPAHPTLPVGDAQQIVTWILSLSADKGQIKKSLPPSGAITPDANPKPNAVLVLSASYTDKGGPNIKPLTGRNTLLLNSSNVSFTGNEKTEGFTSMTMNGANLLVYPQMQGWFALDSLDLYGVKSVQIMSGWQEAPTTSFKVEVRLDSPEGTLLGEGKIALPKNKENRSITTIPLKVAPDDKFHDIYFVTFPEENAQEFVPGGIGGVQFNGK